VTFGGARKSGAQTGCGLAVQVPTQSSASCATAVLMQRPSATAKPAGNRARQDMLIPICPSLFDDVMAAGRLGASWRNCRTGASPLGPRRASSSKPTMDISLRNRMLGRGSCSSAGLSTPMNPNFAYLDQLEARLCGLSGPYRCCDA
jgi:hypothetical protein